MTIEIPSRFPFMDSDAYSNSEPGSAHRRREQERANNRLAARGHEAFHVIYDAAITDVLEYPGESQARGFGRPAWFRPLPPLPVVKKPGLHFANIRIRAVLTENGAWPTVAGDRLVRAFKFQVTTTVLPFSVTARADRHAGTVQMLADGSNAVQLFSLNNVPVSPSSFEVFSFWLIGGMTNEIMDTATYGVNQTGTAERPTAVLNRGAAQLIDSTSLWNDLHLGGHYVTFNEDTQSRIIYRNTSNTEALFEPSISTDPTGYIYNIYQLAPWRIVSVSCYFADRER